MATSLLSRLFLRKIYIFNQTQTIFKKIVRYVLRDTSPHIYTHTHLVHQKLVCPFFLDDSRVTLDVTKVCHVSYISNKQKHQQQQQIMMVAL